MNGDVVITSYELSGCDKKFIQPVSINENFTSIISVQYLDVELSLKGKSTKATQRHPIMIYWDGKEIRHCLCEKSREITVAGENFVIDRDVNETGLLPSDIFIRKLLGPDGKSMIENFDVEKYFKAVHDYFTYYFSVPHEMLYKLISLFAINQHVFDAHDSTPYLYIRSPVRGCGKSHMGQSVVYMANGVMANNLKAHHIFRIVHGTKPSVALDEIKGWTASSKGLSPEVLDILSLVNTGFQKQGGQVPRLEDDGGGKMRTVWYDSYSPKVFITTHMDLPTDTESRCVSIIMQRARNDDVDYGERWYEPGREDKIKEIREMGYLFRLKYGNEIKKLSRDPDWRKHLDLKNEFGEIKNRELEIFRPLVLLCLRFAPDWNPLVSHYVEQNAKMRSRTEPTLVNAVLEALRCLYNDAKSEIEQFDEYGNKLTQAVLETDKDNNVLMYVSISTIHQKIMQHTDTLDLGKGAATKIGTVLKDLGFTTGTIHRANGTIRIIKISRLKDGCERYLGVGLKIEQPKPNVPQDEKMKKLSGIMSMYRDGITFTELAIQLSGVFTETSLKERVEICKRDGKMIETDKVLRWNQ